MSVATQLSPGHQRLQALVGEWRGEETMSATQWAPAGTATSEVVAEAEFGGLFVSQHHRQTRDGRVSFETHNMLGFDPSDGSFKLWQFDSMGFVPPSPASGAWDGNTLTLTRSSPRGARVRLTFSTMTAPIALPCNSSRPAANGRRWWTASTEGFQG